MRCNYHIFRGIFDNPSGLLRNIAVANPPANGRALALGVAVLIAIAFGAFPAQAQAQPLQLQIAHTGNQDGLVALSVAEYQARLNQNLAEEAILNVIPATDLDSQQNQLRDLKLGRIDIAVVSTIVSSVAPEFTVFDVPFLIRDRAHMIRVEDEIVGPELAPLLEARGFKLLAIWEAGFLNIDSGSEPLVSFANLEGFEIAIRNGLGRAALFRSLGADPVVLPNRDRLAALASGDITGLEGTINDLLAIPRARGARHITLTRHLYQPAFVLAAKGRFDGWPENIRTAIAGTARDLRPFVHRRGAEIDGEQRKNLSTRAIEVNEPEPGDFSIMEEIFLAWLETGNPSAAALARRIKNL